MTHIKVNFVAGEANCKVQCPHCPVNSKPSSFWTKSGSSFRVANFKRHFEPLHVTQPLARNQNISNENITPPLARNEDTNIANTSKQDVRLKKCYQIMNVRNVVLSKTNMLLRSELESLKKCMALAPIENVIATKRCNVASESSSVSGDDLVKMGDQLKTAHHEIHLGSPWQDETKYYSCVLYSQNKKICYSCSGHLPVCT